MSERKKGIFNRLFGGTKHMTWTRNEMFNVSNDSSFVHNQSNTSELIEDGYAKVSDLYSIIKKIAQTGAGMELKVYQIKDEEWELQTSGELFDLIMHPNSQQNQYDFKETALTNLLTSGNVFINGQESIGFGDAFTSLYLLPPQFVELQSNPFNQDEISQYVLNIDTISKTLTSEYVKHIKYNNPTDYGVQTGWGLSPIHAGYLAMKSARDLSIAESSILANKGASGLLTNKGDYPLDSEEAKEIQNAIDKKISGANKFGKIITTNASVEYIQMGMSPTDLQLIESGVVKLRQLCNLYGVDSSLFNDPANKTYNNRKEATKSLYTESVIPSLQKIVWGLNQFIVPAYNKKYNAEFRITIDKSHIPHLYEESKLKAEAELKVAEGYVKILESQLTNEQKIKSLMMSYNLTEDEAENIVGD